MRFETVSLPSTLAEFVEKPAALFRILPLEAYFNEDLVLNFDLNYCNDTVHVPPFGVCAMADDSPAGSNFDTSFDPALRFSEAFKASLSEINGPLSHPLLWERQYQSFLTAEALLVNRAYTTSRQFPSLRGRGFPKGNRESQRGHISQPVAIYNTVGCATPETCMEVCGSRSGCSNIAYPSLVIDLMPPGARGLMLAVMLAALMSSLTSIFNSSCTIFAMDIWLHIRKKASELEIMIIGRVFVVVLVVISIVWIPVLRASEGSELFVYIQEVSSFMQPPICCVYLLSILWDRLNELGAFSGLVLGMVVGLIRFIVEYSYTVPDCGDPAPDPRPAIVSKFHYLYFSIFVFCLTGITAIVISLLTKPIDKRCLERLTWKTRHSKRPRLDIDKVMNDASIPELVSYVENYNNGSAEKDKTEMDVFREKEITGKEEAKEEIIDNSSIDMKEKEALNEQNNPVEVVLEDKHNEVTYNEPISIFKRIAYWLCGMDESSRRSLASHGVVREDMVSIKENRKWKITSNVLAVILMGVVVFHFIYFA
ncbi:solute carrier family 5 (sodium/glucose cotransporter), member 9 [Mytilus galloprovincialis]|uniref:Solute carrier family 5 (Sodium/glucose cotransporter), member 9 n=1 Tax=Mytilus galloprovincialis TaxID=29158 RepID=A0A8B6BHB6_MYTGA|nr:solute carrier family 5 (sodium/glucose cotransporter), member 9 [Mytilus galloprovincialis]